MDPGWLILFLFMITEVILVTLLVMPMPNNDLRGLLTRSVAKLWDNRFIKYTCYVLLVIDMFYFYFVFHALLHPLHDFGMIRNPAIESGITCEQKQNWFYNERNAYITGSSLFLFIVLNRLVQIQDKLHKTRQQVKQNSYPDDGGNSNKKTE